MWNHEPTRSRKLLLHRREIDRLYGQLREKGLTLVPTKLYFKDGRVKIELALARGKDVRDKRRNGAGSRREAPDRARHEVAPALGLRGLTGSWHMPQSLALAATSGGRRIVRSSVIASSAALALISTAGAAVASVATRSAALPIVFERIDASGESDVISSTETGKPRTNLTPASPANDASPSVAPNGRTIVFASDRSGHFELWTMNRDGTKQARLTPSHGADMNPSYSPDGKWIAFACNEHGNWDVCAIAANGQGRRNLTSDSATDLDATWSPDSKQIVFDRVLDGKSDIWTLPVKGGAQTNITPGSPLDEFDLAFRDRVSSHSTRLTGPVRTTST